MTDPSVIHAGSGPSPEGGTGAAASLTAAGVATGSAPAATLGLTALGGEPVPSPRSGAATVRVTDGASSGQSALQLGSAVGVEVLSASPSLSVDISLITPVSSAPGVERVHEIDVEDIDVEDSGAPADVVTLPPQRDGVPVTRATPTELSLTAGDAKRWAFQHRAALVLADLGALGVATSMGILFGPAGPGVLVEIGIVAVWLLTLAAVGSYDPRHVGSGTAELLKVVGASVRVALVVVVVAYVARTDSVRGLVLITFPVGIVLLLAGRLCARATVASARRRGHGKHRVLAVGTVDDVLHLIDQSEANPSAGFHVVGACVPNYDGPERRFADGRRASPAKPTHDQGAGDRRAAADRRASAESLLTAGVPIVGAPHHVLTAVSGSQADTVVVAGQGLLSRHALRRLAWQFEGTGVRIYFASSLSDVATPRITLRPLGSMPLLHVESPAFGGSQRVLKGLSDRFLAAILAVLLLPVLGVVAALVRLDSPGPALYRQERIGRGSRTFLCLKFRTMRVGADRELADLKHESDSDGVLFKIREDPRITRVGRILRRYSLDELPQLFNVLGGSMSLVGPRPPLLSEVQEYGHDMQRRLLVKPGMTGLWQVSGRSDLSWAETVRLDLYYVENWTPYFDLQLMARTVGAVTAGRGAY